MTVATGAPWPMVQLGEVAQVVRGVTYKKTDARPSASPGYLPILRATNIEDGRLLLDEELVFVPEGCVRDQQRLLPGDVVLAASSGSIEVVGKSALLRQEWGGSFGAFCAVVRPAGVLPEFLFLYFQSAAIRRRWSAAARGTNINNLKRDDLLGTPVPLPPVVEQRRVVEILEDQLSRLDAAEQIVSIAGRRLVAWQRSSLDRIVRTDRASTGRLRDLVDRIEAGKSFGGSAPPARDGQWGVIKVSAMTWGRFRAEENKAVSGGRIDRRFEIQPGDVLVSRANTTEYVGAPVLVEATPPRLLLSDKSLRLVPREGVEPRWLVQVLAAPSTRRQISLRATGTKDSMRNISQAALLDVTVPVATPEQQHRLIALAESVDRGVLNTRSEFSSARLRALQLRHALLEAAFTGRLSERATYDAYTQEPAGV